MNAYDEFMEEQHGDKLATLEDGIELCKIMHKAIGTKGFYPALTGGLLYKNGKRKDIDIVLYRNRQAVEGFEIEQLINDLKDIDIVVTGFYGFVTKAKWRGIVVDIFNPETNLSLEECYGEVANNGN